ncbi:MAG TPA: tRNA-modifying protein YgfZ [Vibrio sp.]|uniref:tRNA-modifying protein YgfZ n=1 Tax=Vibrio TaxID=662 RepID=UPI0004138FB1|nr:MULTISPECIES: tRNA-modifying protein YgfZ [Vibrio]HCH03185.1 tRNA-modifying protein YgfZ [Vibrio sp.]
MNWNDSFTAYPLTSTQTLPDLVLCHLTSWGAITITGDDKKPYLQGQITSDVVSLEADQSTLGAHCDAKGKMLSTFRLFHHNDGYAMFQRASAIEKELVEIKKYAIFSKVVIEQSADVFLGLMGSQATSFIAQLSGQAIDQDNLQVIALESGTAVPISANRWLLMLSKQSAEQLIEKNSVLILSDERLWDHADVMDALPRIDQHEQLEHIPQAMNLQALGGISFQKGCYTGQETVARAKYRGINKRALFCLQGELHSELGDNLKLERQVGENWRGAGQLNNYYQFSDGKLIALAVLPNNLEPDTVFRLEAFPEAQLSFAELPYSLEEK